VGVDISEQAIEVATKNIKVHGVDDRFELRRSDVLEGMVQDERFDLIISNPPYVPAGDIEVLQPEVRDHEPIVALTGGEDGLSVVRRLVAESPPFLKPGATLMLEIGFNQAKGALEMFTPDIWSSAGTENDFQDIPRIVTARLRG